jgi:hypothetical protein
VDLRCDSSLSTCDVVLLVLPYYAAVAPQGPETGTGDGDRKTVSSAHCGWAARTQFLVCPPRKRTPKPPKLLTHSSLLITAEFPLSRPLGCLVKHEANHPGSNSAAYSPCHPVSYPVNYLEDPPANHLPDDSARSRGVFQDSNSTDYSAVCADGHPAGNSESNPPSNRADNLPDYSEISSVNSLPDYLESVVPGVRRRKSSSMSD